MWHVRPGQALYAGTQPGGAQVVQFVGNAAHQPQPHGAWLRRGDEGSVGNGKQMKPIEEALQRISWMNELDAVLPAQHYAWCNQIVDFCEEVLKDSAVESYKRGEDPVMHFYDRELAYSMINMVNRLYK